MGCKLARVQTVASEGARFNSNKRLLEEYVIGQILGEGAFGVVYACTSRRTGADFAVKMVDKVETPVEAIRREAEMLRDLNHPNIVKFHAVFFERCFVCIVMDRYMGGDLVEGLHSHLKDKGKLHCYDIIHVSKQMADAIAHLHSRGIVHRDVKGDNFLMDRSNMCDSKCRVVLTDFGTAIMAKKDERLSSQVGTKLFWSPEFYARNYSFKVDVWAMGIIVFGLLDGRFPFRDENDIIKKEPRYPKRLPEPCLEYMKGMLQKAEAKRMSAEEVLNCEWIVSRNNGVMASDVSLKGADADDTENPHPVDEMRLDGANHGQVERRRELMERLDKEQKNKELSLTNSTGKKATQSTHYRAKWFTIVDKHAPGSTLKFEWWTDKAVKASGVLDIGFLGGSAAWQAGSDKDPEVVGKMLVDHGIDITAFGKGEAKSLQQLAQEVATGAARLMLDASSHKKLVRVVDVVLLRLYATEGGLSGSHSFSGAHNVGEPATPTHRQQDRLHILIEVGERYPDGRRRAISRLPGTKKEPHENSKETAKRVLRDYLKMDDSLITFNFADKEVFEEEDESPSFPGVVTVYRKEVVTGVIDLQAVSVSSPNALQEFGLPGAKDWSAQDSKGNTKFFSWMTDKQAQAKKVKMKAEGSEEVSGLVFAPIGLKEDDLRQYLQAKGVDPKIYGQNGHKTLKEFSAELVKGESSLQENPDGQLIRVVDLVVLKIVNSVSGDILVQTEQTDKDGSKTTLGRLPGSKRRPDENQFITARRVLWKQLKIDEHQIRLDSKNIQCFEEVIDTPMYGMKTVMRKRMITAELER